MCKKGSNAASPQHFRQFDDHFYCQLRKLPNKMFSSLRNLEVLDLSDNLIAIIEGEALRSLASLKYLDLSRNPLKTLDAGFLCDVNGLEVLLMQGTNFHNFPVHMFDCGKKLKNLTYIDFSDNLIDSIPHNAFRSIPNVVTLNLTSNNINNTLIQRDAFVGLQKLLTIDFTENDLTSIPETLCEHAPEVQYLHMGENRLKSFEFQAVEVCVHLLLLDLSHNDIKSLVGDIDQPSPLQTLKVSQNLIKELQTPGFLRGAQNLTTLDFSMNVIHEIGPTAFDGLSSLKKLDISDNMLKNSSIPLFSQLRSLEELDLSVNNFIKIRSGFFRGLESLKVLNLSRNDFELLEDRAFDGLGKLTVLDLRHNLLATFQDNVFSTLLNLKSLLLSHNKILSLDNVKFPNSLILLDAEENRMEHFPASLSNSYVNKVILDSNDITTLSISDSGNFSQLTFVSLSINRIQTFNERAFQTFTNLKHLNLSTNQLSLNLSRGYFGGADSLVTLDLSHNNIEEINGMFATFQSLDHLQNLILSHNPITHIHNLIPELLDMSAFREPNLQNIFLSFCNISYVSVEAFEGFPNLSLVDLSHNRLKEIKPFKLFNSKPVFNLTSNVFECSCGMRWIKEPEIEMGDQYFPTNHYRMDDCVVLPKHYKMKIRDVPIGDFLCKTQDSCPENCQCLGNSEASHTTVVRCSDVTQVPEGIPRSALRIYLDGNALRNLTFSKEVHTGSFQTQELYVNGSNVSFLTQDFFRPFQSLKKLDLAENRIENLPSEVFANLTYLEELYLRNNSIVAFDSYSLPNSKSLMLLDISHNNIKYLDAEVLEMIVDKPHLRRIFIGNNAFVCKCKNKALRNWIDEHRSRIFDRESILCKNNGKEMIRVAPRYFNCLGKTVARSSDHKGVIVAAVILLCAALLVFASCIYFRRDIIAVFGTKLNIKCFRHHYEAHSIYDVFLMYDFNDVKGSDWANKELIPRLNQFGHKLTTSDSTDLANSLLETENSKIKESKCALFVVTKYVGNNQYYMNCFRVAAKHAREHSQFKVIVVVVGDIDFTSLEPGLKKMLVSGNYITARSRCAWERLEYELPKRRSRLEPFSQDSEIGICDTETIIYNAARKDKGDECDVE